MVSDHCGMVLNTDVQMKTLPKSFRFFKMWCKHPDYSNIIEDAWKSGVSGSPLIRICKKLQLIKGELKKLNRRCYSDISQRVAEAELAMTTAQMNALHDPSPINLEVSNSTTAYWTSICADEESFFRQKSRVIWISEGDKNTSYFHKSMKARQARNFISSIKGTDGILCTTVDQIAAEAVSFYKSLLGTEDVEVRSQSVEYFDDLLSNKVASEDSDALILPVTAREVQKALFSLGADKSPGPDGFTVQFYRSSWGTIGSEVTAAVQSFFD
ncbi:LINE-1 retrotransposable element ORF2 protein [Linum perenne]